MMDSVDVYPVLLSILYVLYIMVLENYNSESLSVSLNSSSWFES